MAKLPYGKYTKEYSEVAVKLVVVEKLAVDTAAFSLLFVRRVGLCP